MVRLAYFVGLLFAGIATVQACDYCQCNFNDGSHCCVLSKRSDGDVDCQAACRDAKQQEDNQFDSGQACASDGKYTCVSAWNARFRKKCYLSQITT